MFLKQAQTQCVQCFGDTPVNSLSHLLVLTLTATCSCNFQKKKKNQKPKKKKASTFVENADDPERNSLSARATLILALRKSR